MTNKRRWCSLHGTEASVWKKKPSVKIFLAVAVRCYDDDDDDDDYDDDEDDDDDVYSMGFNSALH